ncbi:MAG TPA: carbohydrate porin [Myxococcota bacterium]|nr:carbohydrate porin [Myxococcota bacterium]HRY93250.1 carbohydrate porin [Myxococcota bacterium]HSA20696.1 carbohydrate porin [Myxococcota bacterium]
MSGRAWLCLLPLILAAPGPARAEEPAAGAADGEAGLLAEILEAFQFGSYGRVPFGSDLDGGTGRPVKVIAHPPRLLETPYAEVDLGYRHTVPSTGTSFLTQVTVALGERLFHFNGDFAADIAIRNLYLEVRDLLVPGLSLWAGSRMYRGDDIYLLDFWPLDEQNTVGGGLAYAFGETRLGLHFGVNRLSDSYQTQTVLVPGQETGTREVLFMDRQRSVVSLRGEHHFDLAESLRLKAVLYGEVHTLAAGTYLTADQREERLPSDHGWLLGAELSLYGDGPSNHANLYLRYGQGLAIYDELGVPYGLDREKKASGAREVMLGAAVNREFGDTAGVMFGGYARYFVDADPNVYDRDDAWELGLALRPAWYITRHVHLDGELNLQYLRPNGLSPGADSLEAPLVVQLGLMPTVSLGRGGYARPQLRLIYAVSLLTDAALHTYAAEDPLRGRGVQHYLGVSVEWWFHSSRYGER